MLQLVQLFYKVIGYIMDEAGVMNERERSELLEEVMNEFHRNG